MEHNIIVTIDGISHQLEHVPHELGCRYCSLEHFCSSGQRTNYAGLCYAFLGDDAMGYQGYGYFSHKGNCRFCKERRQKELEQLILELKEK